MLLLLTVFIYMDNIRATNKGALYGCEETEQVPALGSWWRCRGRHYQDDPLLGG